MAEILLRTRELINAKEKHTVVKPRGGVVTAISDRKIRNKWIEIICDLMSPMKRDKYTGLPHWDIMAAAWTAGLRQLWIDWGRSAKPVTTDKFWIDSIVPLGLVSQFDNAPESTKPLYETWLWSPTERKHFFIAYNDDATDEDLRAMNTLVEKQDTKERLYLVPGKQYDYEKDITISNDTLVKINDPTQIVNPRFDKPVVLAKYTEPIITGLPEKLTDYREVNSFDPAAFRLFRQREESSPSMHPAAGGYYSVLCDNGVFFGAKYEILDSGLFD